MLKNQLDEMLDSEVTKADWRAIQTHNSLPKLSVHYFETENPEWAQDIDYEACVWYDKKENKGEWHVQGMIHNDSKEKNGIMRFVANGDSIMEATWRRDKLHGLQRYILANGDYDIYSYKEGEKHGLCTAYNSDGSIFE